MVALSSLNPIKKSKVKEARVLIELKKLLDAGFLQLSKIPYYSPLLLLKIKDGCH